MCCLDEEIVSVDIYYGFDLTLPRWKDNKTHIFRTHPQLRLDGVPAIIMFKRVSRIDLGTFHFKMMIIMIFIRTEV